MAPATCTSRRHSWAHVTSLLLGAIVTVSSEPLSGPSFGFRTCTRRSLTKAGGPGPVAGVLRRRLRASMPQMRHKMVRVSGSEQGEGKESEEVDWESAFSR
mmetsp:Transcript_23508/g.41601  ORF Transcript_23508/g.41601 Transcript_23508/m.41601 type:complete len:101 (+) Transcript_23508:191-493(+)